MQAGYFPCLTKYCVIDTASITAAREQLLKVPST